MKSTTCGYISGFSLENFRTFYRKHDFSFSPITLITGTNNSGKSSLFKALRILGDSASTLHMKQLDISLGGQSLGSLENVKSRNSTKNQLRFQLHNSADKHIGLGLLANGICTEYVYQGGLALLGVYINRHNNLHIDIDADDEVILCNEKGKSIDLRPLAYVQHSDFCSLTSHKLGPLTHGIVYWNLAIFWEQYRRHISMAKSHTPRIFKAEAISERLPELPPPFIEELVRLMEASYLEYLSAKDRALGDTNTPLDYSYQQSSISHHRITDMGQLLQCSNLSGIADVHKKQIVEALKSCQLVDYIDRDFFEFLHHELPACTKEIVEYLKLLPFHYIGIGRVEGKRIYPTDRPFGIVVEQYRQLCKQVLRDNLNAKGLYGLQMHNSPQETPLQFTPGYHADSKTNEYHGADFITPVGGYNFVQYWLNTFEIADALHVENIEGVANRVLLVKGDTHTNLADVGFGYMQIVSLLLHIATNFSPRYQLQTRTYKIGDKLYNGYDYWNAALTRHVGFYYGAPKYPNDPPIALKDRPIEGHVLHIDQPVLVQGNGPILLVEEPETNLHPRLQSLLADMLADASYRFNITILVETHSEYLIRRLQYLTASRRIRHSDTTIYYLHHPDHIPEGRHQVEAIRIEPDGNLSNHFGPGFFDESSNLLMSLITGTESSF